MKTQPSHNTLCLSCRRGCKQAAAAVVSVCPRYYPLKNTRQKVWRQLELDLFAPRKS
jgi:hypothetical protein